MTKSQFVFLIGGHDLEMLEICSILDKNNIKYLDHKLDWSNAKLGSYSNYLNDVDHFVGIELIEDIPLPANYIEIDHHNDNSSKPSSILQIIDLLRDKLDIVIEKSRRIDLISANDSGYIPAMEALNATPDEIIQIRESDRKAQGVTHEDEVLAQESINKYLQIIRGVTVVNSLTTKFSAITDRLYPYSQLLIHTDNELTYYGAGIKKLALKYKNLIKSKKAYIGGGESGFFGISRNAFSTKEIKHLKKEIITKVNEIK